MDAVIQVIYSTLNPMADGIFDVCKKIAYVLFVIALCFGVFKHKGSNDAKQLLWLIASIAVAVVCITQMPNWLKHPDGLMWEIGDGVSETVRKSNKTTYDDLARSVRENAPTGTGWFYAALSKFWYTQLNNVTLAVENLMRILQVGLITFGYALSPLFCAMATWSVTRSAAIKFFATLVGFFLWGLVWRFIDAAAMAAVSFGGGPLAILIFNLTTLFILIGYILGPLFITKLFTAGTSGLSGTAERAGVGTVTAGGRSAFTAIKKAATGALTTGATLGVGAAAAAATGGTSAVAQTALKAGTTAVTSTASTAAGATAASPSAAAAGTAAGTAANSTGNNNATTASPSAASTPGPLAVGDTTKAGAAEIKRTSPSSFSMGGREHSGDPNSTTDLNRALFNTPNFSGTEKSAVRMAMSQRNAPTPARNLTQEKNQQVAKEFPV